mgnify:CR=1 FL=1
MVCHVNHSRLIETSFKEVYLVLSVNKNLLGGDKEESRLDINFAFIVLVFCTITIIPYLLLPNFKNFRRVLSTVSITGFNLFVFKRMVACPSLKRHVLICCRKRSFVPDLCNIDDKDWLIPTLFPVSVRFLLQGF